jgi:hypothetical protein
MLADTHFRSFDFRIESRLKVGESIGRGRRKIF